MMVTSVKQTRGLAHNRMIIWHSIRRFNDCAPVLNEELLLCSIEYKVNDAHKTMGVSKTMLRKRKKSFTIFLDKE